MALPPDTDDRKVIDEVLERMGRNTPADRARAYQAFTEGETGKADRFEGWLIPKLVNDPAWKPQPTEADTARAAARAGRRLKTLRVTAPSAPEQIAKFE